MRPIGASSRSSAPGRRSQKQEAVDVAMSARGPYDELIKEFRSGYAFTFDVLMDIGGWRDMHRHRRCQQIQQNLRRCTGTRFHRRSCKRDWIRSIDRLWTRSAWTSNSSRKRVQRDRSTRRRLDSRCVACSRWTMLKAEYIARLRSGVKGHWSYRTVAWLMKQKLAARYPHSGSHSGHLAGH